MRQYVEFVDNDYPDTAVAQLNGFSKNNESVVVESYQVVHYEQTNADRTYILASYNAKEETAHGN